MENRLPQIVVTGDICINTLMWSVFPQAREGFNWQNNVNLRSASKPGESMLLAEMIALATGCPVRSPGITGDVNPFTRRFLHSFVEIEPYPAKASRGLVYRVSRFIGFTGTAGDKPALIPVENDTADADIVVIDDESDGFNTSEVFWPLAFTTPGKSPTVLYKMNNPTGTSALWRHLERHHIEKTVVVINADDLRSKGVNISRSLSWEKTALDFVWQLKNNPNLSFLTACRHLVVLFGLEGVIYYCNDGVPEASLYFLPYEFEGDFTRSLPGRMYGLTSAFLAGLSTAFASGEPEEFSVLIPGGIREGMGIIRKYFHHGFGASPDTDPFPEPSVFTRSPGDTAFLETIQDVAIPNISDLDLQDGWYILQGKSSASIAQMAFHLVINGEENVRMHIPTARFGRLKTVDRIEIESYRTIHNLISEYIATKNTTRPLSIAVFGTPGSGKSYGLTEMATSAFPEHIEKISYNLSQFQSPQELQKAFHKISDFNLLGKIPLIVFDEFDSNFGGSLGWLKYFLSPMQDSLYRDEDTYHPIGKAIFVFAGGTSSSFAEFCGEKIQNGEERRQFLKEFRANKGPDFVSRLRGYINILGPNQADEGDQLYMIRRAMLIRSLIERKLPHLINEKGQAQIDEGVLRALLKIPRYKHESRSVEAVMDMSMLAQAKKWEQSFLPPKEQLTLHLDEKLFFRYMMHDAIFGEKIDAIAQLIRQKYNALPDAVPLLGDDPALSWDDLGEAQKDFYKDHAKNMPEALLQIQYDVLYVDDNEKLPPFTREEQDALVQFEYRRHKSLSGLKSTPDQQVCELSKEGLKARLYHLVSLWPAVLSQCNFKLERLRFAAAPEGLSRSPQ